MKKSAAIFLIALSLTACGKKGALQRAPGMAAPPLAYGDTSPKTSNQLLEPSTQATPERSSEILIRSEVRGSDPFDIPPGGTAQPFPDDEAAKDAPKRGGPKRGG